jgi:hypothetical protein
MGNRALQDASQWEWASDAELAGEALVDETAEREWQELLLWARESGALYQPELNTVGDGGLSAESAGNDPGTDAEDEAWQWELARAKASGGDAA